MKYTPSAHSEYKRAGLSAAYCIRRSSYKISIRPSSGARQRPPIKRAAELKVTVVFTSLFYAAALIAERNTMPPMK